MIFQFEWMYFLMFGFDGLYPVTMTGGVCFWDLLVLSNKSLCLLGCSGFSIV